MLGSDTSSPLVQEAHARPRRRAGPRATGRRLSSAPGRAQALLLGGDGALEAVEAEAVGEITGSEGRDGLRFWRRAALEGDPAAAHAAAAPPEDAPTSALGRAVSRDRNFGPRRHRDSRDPSKSKLYAARGQTD